MSMKIFGEKIYKYRYLIILAIFILCIVFEISGSSIGIWNDFIGINTKNGDGNLLGVSRPIKSDEWAVNIPMAFSQYFNYSGKFSYYSDIIRGTSTDVFIVYGQPVLSWQIIFRPFQWGYLFLSQGRGLSFFWCGRFLGLMVVSFEMGMYLFEKRKSYAFIYTVLLSFSPIVQWWFAINGLVEMLVFGQLVVLLIILYLKEKHYWKKIILMFGLVLCGGGYILVFYPPWQVALGYVYLFLLIGIVMREFKKECWDFHKDIPIMIAFLLILGGSMGSIFYKSIDTIQSVMNTAYPGARVSTGGGALPKLLNWAEGILFPYIEEGFGGTNVVGESNVISFYPLGIIVALRVIIKEKKKNPILISVLAGTIFLTSYCVFPWPRWLAKITLLSYCPSDRAALGVGFLSLILLLYSIYLSTEPFPRGAPFIISYILSILMIKYLNNATPDLFGGFRTLLVLTVMLVGFYILSAAVAQRNSRSLISFCVILALAMGAFVNPVHIGVDVVYKNPLVQAISDEVSKDEDNGLWIVEGMEFPYINIPIMVGAPTINCTNVYPDLERWNKIDTDGAYEEQYNRYAHIPIYLTDQEEATFENWAPDQMRVNLPLKELQALGVQHILTNRDLSEDTGENMKFVLVNQIEMYRIYDVIYTE